MPADRPYIPKRHVHLDFHTGPAVPDVAADFHPGTFAQAFVDARVDSVTVFAKCHHGHLYFDTDHPARHPNLPADLDLLGEQIDALHAVGIKAPIYISVQCDEYAANTHPEWIALDPEGRQVRRRSLDVFTPGWQILDMSSPYQDYVADQLDRVLRRFAPIDGVFFDMCWDQPSVSRWALDGMRRSGLDPTEPGDRGRYARTVARSYMARYRDMVREAQQASPPASIYFNSRPRTLAGAEQELATHVEIEALPTGGWGYAYTPYTARFVRALGLPVFGMTGRFHKSWGDNAGLKPLAALRYECCLLASLGLGVSVGDLLHPRAAPQPAVYQLIGDVYRHLVACEPYVEGTRVVSEVALLVNPDMRAMQARQGGPDEAQIGAVRALQQLRCQFDVVTPDADLAGYRVVVVPESADLLRRDDEPSDLDASPMDVLESYAVGGGTVVLVGGSGVDAYGSLIPQQSVTCDGVSPYSHTFIRLGEELRGSTTDFDTVVYERGFRVRPDGGAVALAQVVEPYFERTWEHFSGHSYTAPDRVTGYAAIVESPVGPGRVVTIAVPLFEAFARHGNVAYREILGGLLDRLLPDPLVRAGGPAHLETSIAERDDGTQVVHLLSFLSTRAGEDLDLITDPFPLVDVPVEIRRADPPSTVRLQPAGTELAFEHRGGYVHTQVTVLDGHALLVLSP